MSNEIRAEREGALMRITLDRPPLNVLTTAMIGELASALAEADADRSIRVVRLGAAGRAFSAGVDVADHVGEKVESMMAALARLFEVFESIRVPVVAVIGGAALGGGCEVALGADLAFASERAVFGQPEIRLGLFAPPASVLLPRIVGSRRALGLLLSGETIDAIEAERIGLVNAVWPAERFEAEAEARIARLLELSGPALRLAKEAVRVGRRADPGEAFSRVDRLYLDELMRTADAHEGLASFLEKRSPRWSHR